MMFVSPRLKLREPPASSSSSGADGDDAFAGLRIDDDAFLDEIGSRSRCDLCSRSRRFFCYTCRVPLPCIRARLPVVDLPVDVHVVKHPGEIDGKSTACHAAMIAPARVRMFTWPDFPSYPGDGSVVVVFPRKPNEKSPEEEPNLDKVRTAIFIDSTWKQTKRLINDPRLADLPRLSLAPVQTLFWRYQTGVPTTYLSTIEAVYHFFRQSDFEKLDGGGGAGYDGRYDNLLFFFRFMYRKLHALYGKAQLKAYKPRDGRDLRFCKDSDG